MRIQWIVSATYALFHSCSSAFSRSIKIGGSFCVVAPYHYRVKMRLLLHQQLHHHFSGVCNRGTRTTDFGKGGVAAPV